MRYKAGDKVIIRDDLIKGKVYEELIFEETMQKNLGRVVEISQIYKGLSHDFYILTDGTKFYTDEMIDHEKTKQLQKGESENMKLSDLKSGHVVKLRNGDDCIVMRNEFGGEDYMFNQVDRSHMGLNEYQSDMIFVEDDIVPRDVSYDIIEVYEPLHNYSLKTLDINLDDKDYFKLVWKREERKRMTVTEIEKELGYKIEIVGEGWFLSNEE